MGCSPVFWNLRQHKRLSADMLLYVRLVASDCPLTTTHLKPVFTQPQTGQFAYRPNRLGPQVTTTNPNQRIHTANHNRFKLFDVPLTGHTATLNTGIHMQIVVGHVAVLIHTHTTPNPHYPTSTSCNVRYAQLTNTVLMSVTHLYIRFMTVYVAVFLTVFNAPLTRSYRFNTCEHPVWRPHIKASLKLSATKGVAAGGLQQPTYSAPQPLTQSTSAGSIPATCRLPTRMPQPTLGCHSSPSQVRFPQPTCCVTHEQRYLTPTRTTAGSSIYDDRKVSFGAPVATCKLLASGIAGMLRL